MPKTTIISSLLLLVFLHHPIPSQPFLSPRRIHSPTTTKFLHLKNKLISSSSSSSLYSSNNNIDEKTPPQQLTTIPDNNNNNNNNDDDNIPSQNNAQQEAEALRQKARELLREANAAEQLLRESKTVRNQMKTAEADDIINQFLDISKKQQPPLPPPPREEDSQQRNKDETIQKELLEILRMKRYSLPKMTQILERMFERSRTTPSSSSEFNIADVRNVADLPQEIQTQQIERQILSNLLIPLLLDTEEILDEERLQKREEMMNRRLSTVEATEVVFAPTLRSRLKELERIEMENFQRQLAMRVSNTTRVDLTGESIEQFVKKTMANGNGTELLITAPSKDGGEFNMSRILMNMMSIPMWVPDSLLGYILNCGEELDEKDVKLIKSDVLQGSLFFVTKSDSTKVAAIFRGNFYPKAGQNQTEPVSKIVFRDVMERLEKVDGGRLGEKVQMFLIEDPEWRPGEDERYKEPKPVILVLPKEVRPEQEGERGWANKILVSLSITTTFITTFAYAISSYALNPSFFNTIVNENDLSILFPTTLPILFGILSLQALHELAHFLTAKQSNIKIGTPVPLPSLQIGTFGSITPLRSFPPTRSSLLDLALSGPAVTLLASILLLALGIQLTIYTPADILPTLPVIPAGVFKTSFLLGSITSILAPKLLSLPLSQTIPIHPLFLIGLTGLVSSALNLLPIGRLDGGRAANAVFGRRFSLLLSFTTLFLLAVAALSGSSFMSILFGLIVTVFQRQADVPVRDDVSEVDDVRFGIYVAMLVLGGLSLVPFPGGVAI